MPLSVDRTDVVGTIWTLTDQQGTVRDLVGKWADDPFRLEHVTYTPFGVPTPTGGLSGLITTFYAGHVLRRQLWDRRVDQLLAVENFTYNGETPTSQGVVWPLTDHQGTVRDLYKKDYNPDGDDWLHLSYNAFGVPDVALSNLNGGNLLGEIATFYAGRELDPKTGLYFNRARWYDPSARRFLSEDPIGYAGGDANLYRYVGNSPTNATDPTGHFAFTTALLVGTFLGLSGVGAAHYGAHEMTEATTGQFDVAQYAHGSAWFRGGVITTGIGGGIVAAPAIYAGVGIAGSTAGISTTGYGGMMLAGGIDGIGGGAFVGGSLAWGSGATFGETALTATKDGALGGLFGATTGGLFHGGGLLAGASTRATLRSLSTGARGSLTNRVYRGLLEKGLGGRMFSSGLAPNFAAARQAAIRRRVLANIAESRAARQGVRAPKKLDELGFHISDFKITDKMGRKKFARLLKDIEENGFTDPVIDYIEICGKPFVLRGNNRLMVAKRLPKHRDQLLFYKLHEFPTHGFNDADEVIAETVRVMGVNPFD